MASSDFDMGTGSLQVNSKRFTFSINWLRNKEDKTETMATATEQTNKIVDPGDTGRNKSDVISVEIYTVNFTDEVINGFRGHNVFLNDLKNMTNQCISEYIASGSINPTTGSVFSMRNF